MKSTSEKRRAYTGPTLFSHGFRVFFLMAGIWAALAMILWVLMLVQGVEPPSRFSPLYWHEHEMLFGYTYAVLAGFLLTAIPNWTGRLPVVGWPTAGLAALWLLGRVVALFSGSVSPFLADLAELIFPVVLIAVLAREIIAGKNWRNLKVLGAVSAFALADLLFMLQAVQGIDLGGLGVRLGAAVIIWLITLIGGRVVPSFTRNWLVRQGAKRLPIPFRRFDLWVILVSSLTLLIWVFFPDSAFVSPLAGISGVLHLVRLYRWAGWQAWRESLVWVLHVAYLFVAIGYFMLAIDPALVPHGWTAGAVALMTLAMMTRASLGHSGRMLTATPSLTVIYLLSIGAALARIAAKYMGNTPGLLDLAAGFWVLAFGGFVITFFTILTRPRIKPKG